MFAKISWFAATIIALFCVYTCVYAQDSNQLVSRVCLGCICEVSSGCNLTVGCSGSVCGPFAITQDYWVDAGKPTLNGEPSSNNGAFSRCVNDPNCAAHTIQSYMARFDQDCTGNGVIDCHDYLRIHRLGAGCHGKLNNKYESRFKLCLQTYQNQ